MADDKEKPPQSEPVEKIGMMRLANMEQAIEAIRQRCHAYVRKFRDLDEEQKRDLLDVIKERLGDVIWQMRGFARTRGEEADLVNLISPITRRKGGGPAGFISRVQQVLSVLQSAAETWQLILTNQPVPSDYGAALWADINAEAEESAARKLRALVFQEKSRIEREMTDKLVAGENPKNLTPEEAALFREVQERRFGKAAENFEEESDAMDSLDEAEVKEDEPDG